MLDIFSLFDDSHSEAIITHTVIPGSIKAKKLWLQIEDQATSHEAILKAKKAGYDQAYGWYKGAPLIKGVHAGDHDFLFLKDKLMTYNGYSEEIANKIAGKIACGK